MHETKHNETLSLAYIALTAFIDRETSEREHLLSQIVEAINVTLSRFVNTKFLIGNRSKKKRLKKMKTRRLNK